MTIMTPLLSQYLQRLEGTQDAAQRDELFLGLMLWVERSFVAHGSPGDQQLQRSELPSELLSLRLTDTDGLDLATWLGMQLGSASHRDGALASLTALPGSMSVRPLMATLLSEQAAATSWSDGHVSRVLDTLLFRVGEADAPSDLPAFQDAVRWWSTGRSSQVLELASRLLSRCSGLRAGRGLPT